MLYPYSKEPQMKILQSGCLYIFAFCFSILFQGCVSTEKIVYYEAIPQRSDNQQIVVTCTGNFMNTRVFKLDFTFRNNSSENVIIDPSSIYLLNDNSVIINKLTFEQTTKLIVLEGQGYLDENVVRSALIGRFLEPTTVPPQAAIQGLLMWDGCNLVFPLWLRINIGNDKFKFKVERQIDQNTRN